MKIHGLLLRRHSGKAGISAEDVRDLMTATVEHRFVRVNQLTKTIESLSDNGSFYTAGENRCFAREINLKPRKTPVESPRSSGMAEAFVKNHETRPPVSPIGPTPRP